LLFRGSRDGWSAKIIHDKIDGQGPTITIIKTRKGKIFGGFASVSWDTSSYGKADNNAFLFSVDQAMKNPVNLSSSNKALFCRYDYGPNFGATQVFCVPDNANTDKTSGFCVNDAYKDLPKAANGNCMYIDGDKNFQVSDFEVYKVIPN